VIAGGEGLHLGSHDIGHFGRSERSDAGDHLLDEPRRQKTGKGNQKHQRRYERQQQVVGQLRGESEAVVVAELLTVRLTSSVQDIGMANGANM
jgi:hypothetical protein